MTEGEIQLLYKMVAEHGWEKGSELFFSGIPLERMAYYEKILKGRAAGWKFLLDISEQSQSALVLDTTLGTLPLSLSRHMNEVFSLYHDPYIAECVGKRLERDRTAGPVGIIHSPEAENLPFDDSTFNMMIIHNMDELLSIYGDSKSVYGRLDRLIDEAKRVIREDGVLCLSFHNRYSYNAFMSRKIIARHKGDSGSDFTLRKMKSALFEKGFLHIESYSAGPSLTDVSSVVHHAGEKIDPEFSAGGIKAGIKRYLKESRGFAPAYILTASMVHYKSFIDKLTEEICGTEKPYNGWKRFFIGGGHTIISLPSCQLGGDAGAADVVIKLPLGRTFRSCEQRISVLEQLRDRTKNSLITTPMSVKSGQFRGQDYSVEGALSGAGIDAPLPVYDDMMFKAADMITAFHLETAEAPEDEEQPYESLVRPLIDKFRRKPVDKGVDIEGLELYLKQKMSGKWFPLVWQHGDYKLENVLVDTGRKKISGIIDWDHTHKKGFPVLDLLHLIATREKVFESKGLDEIIYDRVLSLSFRPVLKNMISRYLESLKIDQDLLSFFAVLYWLHHIVVRCGMSLLWYNVEWRDRNVVKPFTLINRLYFTGTCIEKNVC